MGVEPGDIWKGQYSLDYYLSQIYTDLIVTKNKTLLDSNL